jgi:hypothetical protein
MDECNLLTFHQPLSNPLQELSRRAHCKRQICCPRVPYQMLPVKQNKEIHPYLQSLGQHLGIRQIVYD